MEVVTHLYVSRSMTLRSVMQNRQMIEMRFIQEYQIYLH